MNRPFIIALTAILISCAAILFIPQPAKSMGSPDAAVASRNLSTAADQFEVMRRIVFINGITGDYPLAIEGKCSIKADRMDMQLEVTCKYGPNSYKKHFLGLSDNVFYIVEQMDNVDVSVYHNRIIFKPQAILPDIDFVGDAGELVRNRNAGAGQGN